MKKVLLFSFLLAGVSSLAQNTSDDYFNPEKPKFLSKERVSASVVAGTGVGTFNKSTFYSAFVAPKVGYQLSSRFRMNIGFMHYTMTGNTFMRIGQNEALFNSSKKNVTGNLVFLEGEYQLNKRTTVSAAVMTEAGNFSKDNYKAASFGVRYKTSNNSWIGIQTNISQGQSPYFNTHQGMYNFGSPAMGYDMFGELGTDFTRNLNNSIR